MIEHEDRVETAFRYYADTIGTILTPAERAHHLVAVFDSLGVHCAGCGNTFLGVVGERIVQTWDKELWYYDRDTGMRLEEPVEEQSPTKVWHGPCAPTTDRINHHFRKDDTRVTQMRQPGQ